MEINRPKNIVKLNPDTLHQIIIDNAKELAKKNNFETLQKDLDANRNNWKKHFDDVLHDPNKDCGTCQDFRVSIESLVQAMKIVS